MTASRVACRGRQPPNKPMEPTALRAAAHRPAVGRPNMTFRELVLDILRTYPEQNPKYAEVLSEQLTSIESFEDEVNGYGAYCRLRVSPGSRRLPLEVSGQYLHNDLLVKMDGLANELQFVLSVSKEGVVDELEIVPSDGVGWNGVVGNYSIVASL
jgi:hypothetical protein